MLCNEDFNYLGNIFKSFPFLYFRGYRINIFIIKN